MTRKNLPVVPSQPAGAHKGLPYRSFLSAGLRACTGGACPLPVPGARACPLPTPGSPLPYEIIVGADFFQKWKIKLDPIAEDFIIDEKALKIMFV